jgi:hypothetical protein
MTASKFMKTQFTQLVWAISLAFLPKIPLWAQSTQYFDFGRFYLASQAIPGNWQYISFLNVQPGLIGPSLTISNVTFRGRYLILEDDVSIFSAGRSLFNFDSGGPLTIHFDTGARAFGADFSSFLAPTYQSFTATVSLDNGETFTFTAPTNPNSTFFGFVSPTPIRDVMFSDGGLFGFGNLHEELIGNIIVVTVPEPSTLVFFGLGGFLFTAHLLHRRFRSQI